jgi:chromosome partitioning protein
VNDLSKTITIGMQKGGVGKTTLSVNIAGLISYLLSKSGNDAKVLLIDMDPQASATSFFFSQNSLTSSTDSVVALFDTDNPTKITKNNPSIIKKTQYHNLDIVPAHIRLSVAEAAYLSEDGRRLMYWIEGTAKDYEYILVDCPPSLGRLTTNALMASDFVIVPCQPEAQSVDALNLYAQIIGNIKEINESLNFLGVIISMLNDRESTHKYYKNRLISTFNNLVIGEIHRATHFTKIAHNRQLLIEGDKDRREYRECKAVTLEILKRVQAFKNG